MSQQINVNIRMDKETKEQADNLFSELGFNLTTAVNAFVRQALRERAIPFQIKANDDYFHRDYILKELADSEIEANDPNAKFISHDEAWRIIGG